MDFQKSGALMLLACKSRVANLKWDVDDGDTSPLCPRSGHTIMRMQSICGACNRILGTSSDGAECNEI